MRLSTVAVAISVIYVARPLNASPSDLVNDQVNAVVNTGTFQDPSPIVRPKFRYWLPDASVDPDLVAKDIQEIGQIGAGGIQFLNYYLYGGLNGVPATDWSIYGFGTPAYNSILKAAAEAVKSNGLLMNFEIGPTSGQGVPAEYNNPGLAYDLVSYSAFVAPGETFNGQIPGFQENDGTLVSLTTAGIINQAMDITTLSYGTYVYNITNYEYTFAAETLQEITDQIKPNGTISVTFPPDTTILKYIIYASYYVLSGQRACVAGPNPQNFIQNGSFAVDHFSSRGAKVTTDFLENYVLVNGVKELFKEIGQYMWEDSVEIISALYWTPDLASTFKNMHGYDIGKSVLLLAANNGLQWGVNYPNSFVSDAPDQGQGIVADYRATLSYLLSTYYETLTNWSNEYLGLQFSGQIGYNLPVDMLQVIPSVNAPEDESLGFIGIDEYRQYSGPGNLAGKKIISNEMGAQKLRPFTQTLPELLNKTKRGYVGGNNQMIIHGSPFSYYYPNSTWPGFIAFGYSVTDEHNRHQPAWENGYLEALNFMSRNQFYLQSGVPKRDFFFWDKQAAQNTSLPPLYTLPDVIDAGYSFDYLSPENFNLKEAFVSKNMLATDGPAYKALVIRQTDLLTTEGVIHMAKFANAGLPIIIDGGIPAQIASSTGLAAAQRALKDITRLPNVHQIAPGTLATTLAAIGIQPLTKIAANGSWYSNWREDSLNKSSYVFIFNDGEYSEGTVAFASTRQPFFFDAWTGEQIPVIEFTVLSGYTIIPLRLAACQSLLIGFMSVAPSAYPSVHITSAPESILGLSYTKSSGIVAQVPSSAKGSIMTSDGRSHAVSSASVPSSFALSNWTLIAEKWGAPANLSDIDTIAVKSNTTHILSTLMSWPDIPGLANTSGVGYYSTKFLWEDTSIGAIIDFGRIVHTLRAKINGHPLPPLDYTWAKADISEYLVKGENLIETVAATTMINGLTPIWTQLRSSGRLPTTTTPPTPYEAGMIGTVIITPFIPLKIGY